MYKESVAAPVPYACSIAQNGLFFMKTYEESVK